MSEPLTHYRTHYVEEWPNPIPDGWIFAGSDDEFGVLDRFMVPIEPKHQHQWLPWLTLPNGSSWTQCTGCGEQFQYDH